jgi:Ca2+-binding EF-hand superfamily protein
MVNGAALLDADKAADEVFSQANRSGSGSLSPGELLCHLQEVSAPDIAAAFPKLFLILDADGDGRISREDLRDGYKRWGRESGLRVKTDGPVNPRSAGEMQALEEQSQGYLKPKLEALQAAFNVLDLDKSGKINARKLAAFQRGFVRTRAKEAEQAAAEAEAAGGGAPPSPPGSPALPFGDARTQQMLQLDLDEAFQSVFAKDGKPATGDVEIDFCGFKTYLARHAAAMEGGGGGAKGKKKK